MSFIIILPHCCRSSRQSHPRVILLNLCVSLLALLLVLYIAEAVASTHTGCTVANVLRYYLVLVSLMWNGVEAYNMYLMIVSVFNQGSSKFLQRAAFLSWG